MLYFFKKLDKNAKANAIENLRHINLAGFWWEEIYKEALTLGVKIESFNTLSDPKIQGRFINECILVAQKIHQQQGMEDLYQCAKAYLEGTKFDNGNPIEDDADFEREVLGCFSYMIEAEYHILTSDTEVATAISKKGFLFYENGDVFSPPKNQK